MSVPSLQTTFYRLTIGIDKPYDNNRRLNVSFDDSSHPKKEILTNTRTVFVLCDATHPCPDDEKELKEHTFLQIIDPNTLIDLGKTLKCSVVNTDNQSVSYVKCIVIHKEKIDPPKWIPIPNDNIIDINSNGSFHIRITDRRLGEICFYTKTIEIHGVDVRIYGNEINYIDKDKKITIEKLVDGDKSKYLLSIKGSRLKVTNIRTVDIEEIQISGYDNSFNIGLIPIKIEKKHDQEDDAKRDLECNETRNNWIKLSVVGFLFWVVLTILPIVFFNGVSSTYINVIPRDGQIKEISLSQENTNTFSLVINCGSSKTNIVMTLPNPATFKPQKRLSLEKPVGSGGVTFYFITVCLLYVALYVFVACMTLYFLRILKNFNKLNGNMSSVIEALRNERDKEKRKAMQRKILDDMINTYLDKPSSED